MIMTGMKTVMLLTLAAAILSSADDDTGKIIRPVDGAAFSSSEVDIIAIAPSGKLELDGEPIRAQEPFPNVLHAFIKVTSGVHILSLRRDGQKKEIRFFSGVTPPSAFAPFHQHPPLPDIQCTQCHEVNQNGRFRFKGGCFDCHQLDSFATIHTPHSDSTLHDCGICHNAHGSTTKALLLFPRETACRQCHD
jgi:predicted CXXCH cytochrome family protein